MGTQILSKVALCASITAAALSMTALVPSGAMASSLTVDRGLPTAYLNNVAGANRSNVAWADGGGGWEGDTFNLATASVIDKLTLWVVTGPVGGSFGNTFGGLSLYLGSTSGTSIAKVSSATITGNTSDNANIAVSAVTYSGGANYQGSSGGYSQIWEIDFTNLGAYAAGDYMFALTGPSYPPGTFLHASNATLGGATADGADNIIWFLTGTDGAASLAIDSSWDSNGNGWDKSSDLNVQVFTSETPLPAALPLFLSGSGVFGFLAMRRKRKATPELAAA